MKTFKSLLPFAGRSLTILSLIFLFLKLGPHFNDIPRFTLNFTGAATVVLAILFNASTVAIQACLWPLLLRGGGVFLNFKEAYLILGKSQIGKYLPGNVFQYLGRVALSRKAGIPTEAVLISTGIETGLLAATVSALAAAGLLFDRSPFGWLLDEPGANRVSMTLLAIMIIIILLAILTILCPRLRAWIRLRIAYLNPLRVTGGFFLSLMVFMTHGIMISLLLDTLWGIETELKWYQFSWGFALAWGLGFITPGAPGGLGIREVILVGLFGQPLGEAVVLGLALVLRIITSLGDLLAFGMAVWLGRRVTKQDNE